MPDWTRLVREKLELRVPPAREAEIVSEIAQQLESKYAELLSEGMSAKDAFDKAGAQVSDWAALSREINAAERPDDAPGIPPSRQSLIGGVMLDFRYALRTFRKAPIFAAVTIAILALGLGANTAMFTIVNAVALRKLPYPDAGRLVTIGAHRAKQPDIAEFTSAPDFFDLRLQSRALSDIAGVSPVWSMITGDAQPERLECLFVSANFFSMMGARAALGRLFTKDEDQAGHAAPRAVLGHAYWTRRFGARPDVLNKTVILDNGVYTIVGVLPAGFRYLGEPLATTPSDIDVYLPMAANPLIGTPRSLRFMKVVARLAAGVSMDQAREEVQRIAAALTAQYPRTNSGFEWQVHTLEDEALGKYRSPVFLLLGAVGLVLLLSSANVANMLLARVAGRRQEISIRTALGASTYRILRQLLSESLVLTASGAVAGAGIAVLLLEVLRAFGPKALMSSMDIRLDATALLFTGGIAILACVLSGLTPAWFAARADSAIALRAGSRTVTARTRNLRSGLVIGQIALALVLLVGAGLLIRSFQNLLNVDPGFRPENLATISTQLPASARTGEQRTALYELARARLLAIPGVEQVAAVSRLPMMGSDLTSTVTPEGRQLAPGQEFEAQFRRTTGNYFQTMGIRLLRGRVYDDHDPPAAAIALIDETSARMLWPGEDAVGKRIKVGAGPAWTTIIGVTAAMHHFGLDVLPQPTIYVPYAANPLSAPILVIRTNHDPAPILNSLSDAVRGAAKGLPAYNVFAMQTLVDRSTAQRRFMMMLLAAFAGTAMVLAAVGLHGSIAQTVSHRTREIGLRIALGASPLSAFRMVAAEGVQLISVGVAIGALAAIVLTRMMRSVLFGVQPLDPWAFVWASAVLATCALLACSAPAMRATRVDPLTALRDE